MRDTIIVLDEFLPPDVYANLARFISNETMSYGSRSNSSTDPHGHWSRQFATAGRHNLADIGYVLDAREDLATLNLAWKFLRMTRLKKSVLIRCYLNGYTYGTDGYFHSDSTRPDEHTAILFMNEAWEPDWGGETVFLDPQGEIVRSVLPKRNRAIIFPASLRHAGRGVSRKCGELRRTLIFKARKRRSNGFEKLSVFLRQHGATTISHKDGSLHDHLVRTFALLESVCLPEDVCFGGGLHAIYGTRAFTRSLMTPADRRAIADQFGDGAERLAFLFSVLDRPKTLETPLEVGPDGVVVERPDGRRVELPMQTFEHLRAIECANLFDQRILVRHESLARLWASCTARHQPDCSPPQVL